MQVHPTRSAVHLAIAASLCTLSGLILQSAPIVAFGGAVLLGLGIARAVTEVSVARIRASGFEMLWQRPERVRRVARGARIEIEAEVRNRDARAARYVGLRPVASPELEIRVTPTEGEVPAGGRLRITVEVTGLRVGRHAVHGLSLEVRGGPGLFEVPLTFANPFGIEVLPSAYGKLSRSARGGRSRREAEQGRSSPFSGESGELRELRQHQAGDPFRRIAWKASAKRGTLLVREYEREERDVVLLLVDAAVELAAGPAGTAALDRMLDEAAALGVRHLQRGDRVGLGVIGRRVLAWLPPKHGLGHSLALLEALSHAVSPVHADRSGLDEADAALRVLEHMRPLDPETAGNVAFHELDRIARRADKLRSRAPFPEADAFATTRRERTIRRYLEAFGLGSPLRLAPDRSEVDEILIQVLNRVKTERSRPSLIVLWSPVPEPPTRRRLLDAVARVRSRRTEVVWTSVPLHAGLEPGTDPAGVVAEVLLRRSEIALAAGESSLRKLGLRVERMSLGQPSSSPEETASQSRSLGTTSNARS